MDDLKWNRAIILFLIEMFYRFLRVILMIRKTEKKNGEAEHIKVSKRGNDRSYRRIKNLSISHLGVFLKPTEVSLYHETSVPFLKIA